MIGSLSSLAADSGYHAVKLPFPLTLRFKSMLQSGVMTRDLDVRWVSSLSWYFLNLFGLQSVFIFILGDDNGEPLPTLRFPPPPPARPLPSTKSYQPCVRGDIDFKQLQIKWRSR